MVPVTGTVCRAGVPVVARIRGRPAPGRILGVRAMTEATAAAVARRYGLGRPLRPPAYAARGELGLIFRLDTDRGAFAVKESLIPVDERDAAADVAFQRAAAAAGVRLPRPVPTVDGRVVADGVRVYAWVDLDPTGVATVAEVGAVAARLHGVGHPAAGAVADWFAEPLGADGWHALLAAGERASAGWAGPLRDLLADLVALDAVVRPPDPARVTTCHLDLNRENVRRARDGGVVVLDWENSGPCQPERELAALLADLPAAETVTAYRAYRVAGGPARVTGPADFSTAVAVQGHLLDFYGRRSLDPASSAEDVQRSRDRLADMLARPLTLSAVDALIDVCRR
jgi:Ser/Thr protein kinase RdoA (MazF antagonist)